MTIGLIGVAIAAVAKITPERAMAVKDVEGFIRQGAGKLCSQHSNRTTLGMEVLGSRLEYALRWLLQIHSPQPAYPAALKATAGQSTEILLFLLTKGPMKTTFPLTNRFRGSVGSGIINPMVFVEPEEFIDHLPYGNVGYLNKFKATLTPAQMSRDIEFLPDPSAQPFREHFHRW